MARYRSENKMTATAYTFTYAGSTSAGSGPLAGFSRSMTDVLTPGFKKLQAQGKTFVNYMESIRTDIAVGMLSNIAGTANGVPFSDTGHLEHLCCLWNGPSSTATRYDLVPGSEVHRLAVEASTRCLSQIGRSDANNWENLAEVGKTLQMLKSPVRAFYRWTAKKGRVNKIWRNPEAAVGFSADEMASLWLSFRYGVMPVVKSWNATEKQIRDRLQDGLAKPERVTTRASRTLSSSTSNFYQASDGTYIYSVPETITETHTIRAMSLDEQIWTMADTLGLGSKDLITLPWELIPYSFVVDWFLNVGDYIGAMVQSVQPKALARCYTIQSVRSKYRETATHTIPSNYIMGSLRRGWVREDIVWKTRYPWLEAPGLVIKHDFRLDELTRLGDAYALIGQRIARIFSKR